MEEREGHKAVTIYGKRLVEAMVKNNLSVKQLATKSGISTSTIYSALDRDAIPNAFTLAVFADTLGVTMDWLWGRI